MRLAILLTALIMGVGVAVACWGTTRVKNGTESVEADLLGAWRGPPPPGRNKESDIVFEELVIRARPTKRKAQVKAFRTEPQPQQTASR